MAKNNSSGIFIGIGLLLLYFTSRASSFATQFANNFQVSGISINNLKLSIPNVKFNIQLIISNFNSLPVKITGANLRLKLDDKVIGNIITNRSGVIAAQSESSLTVPTTISLIALGFDIANTFENQNSIIEIINTLTNKKVSVIGQVFGSNGISINIDQIVNL